MRILFYIAMTIAFALTLAPKDASAYRVYFATGESMDAESHRVEDGKVYLKLSGGEAAFDAGQIDMERTLAERDAHKKTLAKAEKLISEGDTEAAADIYSGVVGPDTSDMRLLETAGDAFMKSGRFDRATDVFNRMQEIDPETPGIRTRLGEVYYGQGEFYEAIDQFLLALDADQQDRRARLGLGMCYARQEMYEGAKSELTKAIEIYPEYAEAFATLGYVYYKKSEFTKAENMLSTAIGIDDRLPEAHYYMGLLYGILGVQTYDSTERIDYIDKSVESFRMAVTLRKFYPEAHADLGVAYYNRGSVARAIEEFGIALNQKPDMAVTHSNLAGVYNHQGFYKEAVAEAEAAVAIDPHIIEAYMTLGNAYANLQDFRGAAKAYDRYLYYAPSGPLSDEAAARLKWALEEGGLSWPLLDDPDTPDGGV